MFSTWLTGFTWGVCVTCCLIALFIWLQTREG